MSIGASAAGLVRGTESNRTSWAVAETEMVIQLTIPACDSPPHRQRTGVVNGLAPRTLSWVGACSDRRSDGQEVAEQAVDLLGDLELHPVARSVKALIPPGTRDVLGGVGHLRLAQRHVACAPDPHRGGLGRRELWRWPGPGLRRDVRAVPVQTWGE